MARRVKFDMAIACLDCGKTGRAHGDENHNPVEEPLNPRVDSVTEGFRIEGNKVVCESCGKTVF